MVQDERHKIITDLFRSKELSECIAKMHPTHLQEELRSEVFLVLCELPEDRLNAMHSEGRLGYYALRTIMNMAHSSTSSFFKMFRADYTRQAKDYLRYLSTTKKSRYDHLLMNTQEMVIRDFVSKSEDLSDPDWYEAGIMKVYTVEGTMRAASHKLGIPVKTIHTAINNGKKKIKEKLCSK